MKLLNPKGSSILLLFIIFCCAARACEAAEVVGLVTAADTKEPIPHALVRAIPVLRGQKEMQTQTGANGRFLLDLLRGKYRLFISVPDSDYIPQFYSGSGLSRGDVIDVATFDSFRILDVPLVAGGSIEGVALRDFDKAPIPDLRVQALSDGYSAVTETDRTGNYRFRALPVGQYRIKVLTADENFISIYYDNTRTLQAATLVTVRPRQAVPHIDFRLQYGGTISGRVYANKNRESLGGIRIIAENQNQREPPYFAYSDDSGFYALKGLTEGSYTVHASLRQSASRNPARKQYVSQYHDRRYVREMADRIELESGSVLTGIDFSLFEASSISGTVHSHFHNQPLGAVFMRPQSLDQAIPNLQDKTDTQGNYAVGGLPPGNYIVEAILPKELQQLVGLFFRDKLSSEKADSILLAEGDRIRQVDFILPLGATVRGNLTIDDPEYVPSVNGRSVVFMRQGADGEGYGKREFKVRPNGSFAIEQTPPGQYVIKAQLHDPNLVAAAGFQEKKLEVTEGGAIEGVELPLRVVGSISGTIVRQSGSKTIEDLVLMLVNNRDNTRTYFELSAEKYVVPGLEPGRYLISVLTKPSAEPSVVGMPSGQVYDLQTVEVQKGKTSTGINLQIPAEPVRPPLFP